MLESAMYLIRKQARERAARPDSLAPGVSDVTDEIRRHFRDNSPIMLDGALPVHSDSRHLLRHAKESLSRGRDGRDLLPAAVLRETLAAIESRRRPATAAGLVAVGPRRARVWWDPELFADDEDILAGLDRPRAVLRFYDVTGLDPDSETWNDRFDIDVSLIDRGKTVDFWAADKTYLVDMGVVHADGRFTRLARTNLCDLPRERGGEAGLNGAARSALGPRSAYADPALVPDADALEWADLRPDRPERDLHAEMLVHMLYRAFLAEGPRALRRAPAPAPGDPDVLRDEYRKRRRSRQRQVARAKKPAPPAVLVVRLDSRRAPSPVRSPLLPAPAGLFAPVAALSFRNERPANSGTAFGATPHARALSADSETPADLLASPVFDVARSLRRRLAATGSSAAAFANPQLSRHSPERPAVKGAEDGARLFGGAENRRFAKAGVKFTRVALTLEGKMRPGARLKVAGKLVYADAEGNFRLECVLSGRRASIPVRAGVSSGGEALGVIGVDWNKRTVGERKALLAK